MIASVLLAASIATSFLDDFKGSWLCGTQKTPWTIAASGERWATVTYGEPEHPYGVAYVGYLDADSTFSYNDFHTDGALARLTAPAPVNHTYHWTGVFYPVGKEKDTTADIYWKLSPKGTLVMEFGQMINGTRTPRGGQECTKQ